MRLRVALFRAHIPGVVFLLLAIVCSTKTLFAQGFDRIERERALAMLATIKDQLKKNYYDPNIRGMDLDARFKTAEEKIKQAKSLGQTFGIIACLSGFFYSTFENATEGGYFCDRTVSILRSVGQAFHRPMVLSSQIVDRRQWQPPL